MSQNVEQALIRGLKILTAKYVPRVTSCISKNGYYSSNYIIKGIKPINSLKGVHSSCWLYQSHVFYTTYEEAVNKTRKKVDQPIVYYGALSSKIKGVKVLSLSTSLITLIIQPWMYNDIVNLGTPAMAALYTVIGFFTFVTPFLIHTITKKYVMEIKYDPSQDCYISKTMTFFLRNKTVNFKLDDIKAIDSPSIFNTFLIKGKPVMVFQEGFLDDSHYVKIMGYDKPIDMKLAENSNESADSKKKSQSQN